MMKDIPLGLRPGDSYLEGIRTELEAISETLTCAASGSSAPNWRFEMMSRYAHLGELIAGVVKGDASAGQDSSGSGLNRRITRPTLLNSILTFVRGSFGRKRKKSKIVST